MLWMLTILPSQFFCIYMLKYVLIEIQELPPVLKKKITFVKEYVFLKGKDSRGPVGNCCSTKLYTDGLQTRLCRESCEKLR